MTKGGEGTGRMAEDSVRMEKAANLLRLALLLAGSAEGRTIDEIAGEFGVHRRTAERMRDAVRDLFPGFEARVEGREHRFRIQGGLSAFLTAPTVSELAELEAVCRSLERRGHQPRATLLRALGAKVQAGLRDALQRQIAPDLEALCRAEAVARQVGPHVISDAPTLALLRAALIAMKRVRFSYPLPDRPRGYVRTVIPYGLLFGRSAYLVGRESGRRLPVLWRLDRLSALEMTPQAGAPPASFNLDSYAARSFGTFQEEAVDVVLRFRPSAAQAAAGMMFHPTQTTALLEDGSLEVRFTAGGLLEMVHHLFSWGDAVEILAPPALKDLMVAELTHALARHAPA